MTLTFDKHYKKLYIEEIDRDGDVRLTIDNGEMDLTIYLEKEDLRNLIEFLQKQLTKP